MYAMKYKRLVLISILAGGLLLPALSAPPQESTTPPQQRQETPPPVPEKKLAPPIFSYNPEGRRDPFKDLFGGKEIRDKKAVNGLADMDIDEITLMGIVKSKDRLEAIISFSDGFPMTLREGQKLADGYVLSIEPDRVIFRKTSDRGIPLAKPKDVIKEITPEEPSHE